MSVSIKYKGAEIASASTEATKTIKTAGKYCEADILVENTPDGGGTPVINPLSVTANGTYTAPSGVDGYSPVTVNVQGSGGGRSISGSIVAVSTSYAMDLPYANYAVQYYLDPLDAATFRATTSGTFYIKVCGVYNPSFYPSVSEYTAIEPTITAYGDADAIAGERQRNGTYSPSFASSIGGLDEGRITFSGLVSGCKYYYKIWELT